MKLVINADDFGYTKGVTYGIIEGNKKGIIRSTTVLANSDHMLEMVALTKDLDLGIGVHLNLTLGKPLTVNKTLTAEDGNFYKGRNTIWTMNPSYDEIYLEWKAQIERYIEVFGHKPTHLDSHHSVHDATKEAYAVSSRLAKEYGLQMRRYGSFKYVPGFYGEYATAENLIKIMDENADEDIEIMVHPAYCDLDLYRDSSYSLNRVKELNALCDPKVISYINEHHVELVHY